MKCFNIPFKTLDINIDHFPTKKIVPDQLFNEWENNNSLSNDLRKKAALRVQNIRSKRKQILNATYEKCENYRKEKYENLDKEIDQKKDDAIKEIFSWLKDVKKLEEDTYQQILTRAKKVLADSLNDIYEKIPWATLLGDALQNYMLGQKSDTIGHLLVNKDDYDELKKSLDSYPHLKFEISEKMKSGIAKLETDYFTIVVEIPRQIDTLRQSLIT